MQNKEWIKISCCINVSPIYLLFLERSAKCSSIIIKKKPEDWFEGRALGWGKCLGVSESRSCRCAPGEGVCWPRASKGFPLGTETSRNQETKRNIQAVHVRDCWGNREVSVVNHYQGRLHRPSPLIIWQDLFWDKKTPIPSRKNWEASLA